MVEKSHPQVIGLDRGNPGLDREIPHTNGSLDLSMLQLQGFSQSPPGSRDIVVKQKSAKVTPW